MRCAGRSASSGRCFAAPISLVFGFSLAAPPQHYGFDAFVCYGKGRRDRVAYIGVFRIGDEMRANLFVYRSPQDEWSRQFRAAPSETLMRLMPELEGLCGRLDVTGDIAVRSIDLTAAKDYRRDGVVLLGDAFRTCCPIIGMGIPKVLTDVEQLCTHHLPGWLATPGMGAAKISQFYDDKVKTECDAASYNLSLYAQSVSVDPGLVWRARRVRNAAARSCIYGLTRTRQRLAGTAVPALRHPASSVSANG